VNRSIQMAAPKSTSVMAASSGTKATFQLP
jgi:hypothetical protein